MSAEHNNECPVGEHEARLTALERLTNTLDAKVREIEMDLSAREERDKNIDRVLKEIKEMIKSYTEEMKATMMKLAAEMDEIRSRPSKIWDALVFAVAASAGASVFALVSKMLGGN